MDCIFTTKEAAALLKITVRTLVIYARSQKIGFLYYGRQYHFTQAHIDKFLAGHSFEAL